MGADRGERPGDEGTQADAREVCRLGGPPGFRQQGADQVGGGQQGGHAGVAAVDEPLHPVLRLLLAAAAALCGQGRQLGEGPAAACVTPYSRQATEILDRNGAGTERPYR